MARRLDGNLGDMLRHATIGWNNRALGSIIGGSECHVVALGRKRRNAETRKRGNRGGRGRGTRRNVEASKRHNAKPRDCGNAETGSGRSERAERSRALPSSRVPLVGTHCGCAREGRAGLLRVDCGGMIACGPVGGTAFAAYREDSATRRVRRRKGHPTRGTAAGAEGRRGGRGEERGWGAMRARSRRVAGWALGR